MKKNILIFILFFWILFSIWMVYAASNKENIENFEKKQYNLIFESNLSNISSNYSDIFDISRKADFFKNLADKVDTDTTDIKISNIKALNQIASLQESIAILDQDIEKIYRDMKAINLKKRKIKEEIDLANTKMKIKKKEISRNKTLLLEYLDYIYKKGNNSFQENKIDNIKSLLLNWEDIWEMINDLYFNWLIETAWQLLIDKYKKSVKELYFEKVKLEQKEINLNTYAKRSIIKNKILKDKRDYKQRLLDATKWKQEYYEEYLQQKQAIETKLRINSIKEKVKIKKIQKTLLKKYNCKAVDLTKNTIEARILKTKDKKCYNLNRMIYSEAKLKDNSKRDYKIVEKYEFSWPVKPFEWISAYFHDPEYKKDIWAEHNAIDIRVPQWTPIKASRDWYIIYINKPTSQDYSFVVIKHFDWYISVYWHLSEVFISEFDYVQKWQVFAKSWWEYWTKWAWYITTWPHLHFEVFKDKKYIDPLSVLDLSYLNYKSLPKKYKKRFLIDFKNRNGYLYNTLEDGKQMFTVIWETEIERQQYFIKHYANWVFNNWKLWVDLSLDWNIDPSLAMCIWLAESSLWNNITTPYNVWNVWNNDRWDRKVFTSAKQWIFAIISTLNNKYLENIGTVNLLSWAWRVKTGYPDCSVAWQFCYATDLNHWHNNVVKCLSHLKWSFVGDDYYFRIME